MMGDTNAQTTGRKPAWNCVEIGPNVYQCRGYASIETGAFALNSATITLPVADVNNGTGLFPVVTWLNLDSGWASAYLTVQPSSRTATTFKVWSWGIDSSMTTMSRDFSWMCIVKTA